jgi:8-oxo-dGTP pyrophosphatase MutT (NUDIX family)
VKPGPLATRFAYLDRRDRRRRLAGETERDALARELAEELGREVTDVAVGERRRAPSARFHPWSSGKCGVYLFVG